MRSLRTCRMVGGIGAASLLLTLMPFIADDYALAFVTGLLCWIALSESWVLLSGYSGYISLGHAAFVGAGAYVLVLTWGVLPFWMGMVLSGLTGGVLAAVVGIPCLRVQGPYFVILTLGVAEFLKFLVINIEASLGSFGRLLLNPPSALSLFYVSLVLALIAFCGALFVRNSKFGAGLRAIRENEVSAEMTGVPVGELKSIAYVLSAIIPAMVGCVMVGRSGYFEPTQIFSPQISLTIIAICVAGGSDNAWGPLLGALMLTVLSELLRDAAPQLYLVVLGVVLIVFVLKVPGGLQALLAHKLEWLRSRRIDSK